MDKKSEMSAMEDEIRILEETNNDILTVRK